MVTLGAVAGVIRHVSSPHGLWHRFLLTLLLIILLLLLLCCRAVLSTAHGLRDATIDEARSAGTWTASKEAETTPQLSQSASMYCQSVREAAVPQSQRISPIRP